jgi:putative DNA primase/helicase
MTDDPRFTEEVFEPNGGGHASPIVEEVGPDERPEPPVTGENNHDHHTREASPDQSEISRAAAMSPLQYERDRVQIAKRLGIKRVSILDKIVAAERAGGDDGLQGRELDLPEREPWEHPIDGDELLASLSEAVRGYVVMPKAASDVCALWLVHTYLVERSMISPILAVRSPEKQCGKTTLLDVLSRVAYRPLLAANVSPAALFRTIPARRPTLMLDEADASLPDNEDLRCILNAAHRRGGCVIRTVGEQHEPRMFDVYTAIAIALIGRLPGTLADRSIAISLRRRRLDEAVKAYRLDDLSDLDILARQSARWAQDIGEDVALLEPELPARAFNRVADNWRPLFRIAEAAGGEWPARCAKAFDAVAVTDEDSIGPTLLADIRGIFADRSADRLRSVTIGAELAKMESRPWAEWGKQAKPISVIQIARLLKPFGVKPDTVRFGEETDKGYLLEWFMKWALLSFSTRHKLHSMLRVRIARNPITTGFVTVLRVETGEALIFAAIAAAATLRPTRSP